MRIEITPLVTLPEIIAGDDVGRLIGEAARREAYTIDASVIVAVAQKIVSKAEGCVVDLSTIQPSALAARYASEWDKDPRVIEVVLTQSKRIVKMDPGNRDCRNSAWLTFARMRESINRIQRTESLSPCCRRIPMARRSES